MNTNAFKKGKTSGNYLSEEDTRKLEDKYREIAKQRATMNKLGKIISSTIPDHARNLLINNI